MQKYKEAIIWIVHEISGSDIGEYLQLENINVQKEKISHLEVLQNYHENQVRDN